MTVNAGVVVKKVKLLDTVWECELVTAIWKLVMFLQKLEIGLFGGQRTLYLTTKILYNHVYCSSIHNS